jgi:phage terminase small subunit
LSSDSLTTKQKVFVLEYLVCFNATEAAERAGYKGNRATLAVVGLENLRKPKIRAEIKRFLIDMTMMQEEALARIAQQARGSMGDFLSMDDYGRIRFDLEQAKKAGAMNVVQQVRIRPVVEPDGVVRQSRWI